MRRQRRHIARCSYCRRHCTVFHITRSSCQQFQSSAQYQCSIGMRHLRRSRDWQTLRSVQLRWLQRILPAQCSQESSLYVSLLAELHGGQGQTEPVPILSFAQVLQSWNEERRYYCLYFVITKCKKKIIIIGAVAQLFKMNEIESVAVGRVPKTRIPETDCPLPPC